MVLVEVQKTLGAHFAELGGHSAPVDGEVIGQLLPVKRDFENALICLARLLGEVAEQLVAGCTLGELRHLLHHCDIFLREDLKQV